MRKPIRITLAGLTAASVLACGDSQPESEPATELEPRDSAKRSLQQEAQPTFDEQEKRAEEARERRRALEAEKAAALEAAKKEEMELEAARRVDPLVGATTDFDPVDGIPKGFPKAIVDFDDAEILKAYESKEGGTGVVVLRIGGDLETAAQRVVKQIKSAGWELLHEQADADDRRTTVYQRGKKSAQVTVMEDPEGAILQAFVFDLLIPDAQSPS